MLYLNLSNGKRDEIKLCNCFNCSILIKDYPVTTNKCCLSLNLHVDYIFCILMCWSAATCLPVNFYFCGPPQ